VKNASPKAKGTRPKAESVTISWDRAFAFCILPSAFFLQAAGIFDSLMLPL
jgi:hypothetical protein